MTLGIKGAGDSAGSIRCSQQIATGGVAGVHYIYMREFWVQLRTAQIVFQLKQQRLSLFRRLMRPWRRM